MRHLGFFASGLVVLVACGSFGAESPPAVAGGPDAGPDDDAATTDSGAKCPGTAGPQGVRVGTYCIDATEVTRGQYQSFINAKGPDVSGQPVACKSNVSYVPPSDWPPAGGEESMPVIHVDWCDAYAFCAWAGKRLCGKIGGGPVSPKDSASANVDQWFAACSMGGPLAFPYGQTYEATRCNGADANPSGKRVRDVASYPSCQGGFPGLFDMSGNAFEWVDSCDAEQADPSTTKCRIRGGDFNELAPTLGCSTSISQARIAAGRFGFRCCSP